MRKPNLLDSFTYNGETIHVEWFDAINTNQLPDVSWQQVYAVAKLEGKVVLVIDAGGNVSLPGGKTEPGESIEQTLKREIQEETNCRVSNWSIIGYQRLTGEDESSVYQLRVYAQLEKIGEFKYDPGGEVVGYKLINMSNLNKEIGYGKVGERISKIVSQRFR